MIQKSMSCMRQNMSKVILGNYKVNHIGIFTKNIDKTLDEYQRLGFVLKTNIVFDSLRSIRVVLLEFDGIVIELIEANDDKSFKIFDKVSFPVGYHICFEVKDLDNTVQRLVENNYHLITPPKPAEFFDKRRVVFLYHKFVGMVELVES